MTAHGLEMTILWAAGPRRPTPAQPTLQAIPDHLNLLLQWDVEQRCLPRRSMAPFSQWRGIFRSPTLKIFNSAYLAQPLTFNCCPEPGTSAAPTIMLLPDENR